jgi:integrase
MASLWKKRDSWYLRPKAGKPQCLGAIPEAAARAALAEVRAREARQRVDRVVPGLTVMNDALTDWWAEKRARRPLSEGYYGLHLRHIREHFPVNLPLVDVRAEHVSEYMNARVAESKAGKRGAAARKCSRLTADKERGTLAIFFNWCCKRRLLTWNPAAAVDPFGDQSAEREAAPADLVAEVVAAIRGEAKAKAGIRTHVRELVADLIEVFYWTGWRLGEGCRLLVGEIDQRAWTCPIKSAHNKGPSRAFPIPPEVQAIFKRNCKGKESSDHVFSRTRGENAYASVSQFRRRWCKRFPEHRPAFFHSLRHAYASDATRSSDTITAKKLTRHRTIEMLDHYSHRELSELREGQARLSKLRKRLLKPRRGARAKRA